MTDAVLTEHSFAKQWARFKRAFSALVIGGAAHTFICWMSLQLGFFRGGTETFYSIFAVIWLVHLSFLLVIVTGLNRRLRDPALVLPLMIWSTTALLWSAYYVSQIRLPLMLLFFAILQVGVMRGSLRQFAPLGAYCVLGYALILVLVGLVWPEELDARIEWLQWALFALMVLAIVLLAGEIAAIRSQLSKRNRELSRLVGKVEEMAVKDELTGFYRRLPAMSLLNKACGQASRGAFSLAVAYLDLDHFKPINDNYGHKVGDEVLRRFAERVSALLAEKDFAARLGGEEFMLVMPVEHLEEAAQTVNRVLADIREQRFDGLPDLRVTVSAGLALLSAPESPEQLVQRADQALYQAKHQGRDQLIVAELP